MTENNLAWDKMNHLIPVIVQDAESLQVLMLGYMNQAALRQTMATKRVTFYSREKQRLWVKGETSGNFLQLVRVMADCDQDSLLILAQPTGPTCHLQTISCFAENDNMSVGFLVTLWRTIAQRQQEKSAESYTYQLMAEGIKRIAQKVAEEGVEVALAAVGESELALIHESADLLYHFLVLLQVKNISLTNVTDELLDRFNYEKIGAAKRD